jgi:hypothetical protein
MAHALRARAFTIGADIVFGRGEYAPESEAGRWLIAHELSHVVQQRDRNPPLLQREPLGGSPTGSSALQEPSLFNIEPTTILPDAGPPPAPGQMTESEFKRRLREALNVADIPISALVSSSARSSSANIGDLFVTWLEQQSALTQRPIEPIVQDILQMTAPTADDYISLLSQRVPETIAKTRAAVEALLPASPDVAEALTTPSIPISDAGQASAVDGNAPGGALYSPSLPTPTVEEIRRDHPEITPPLAGILAPMLPSQWGLLSAMLQGTIFHAIISAGYVAGYPPPSHVLALVNRGGGALGRRRTDLRDPVTGSVIEIKPEGDTGGDVQLAQYVAALGPPWHPALDVPTESWAPPSAPAHYELDVFGVKFVLIAENSFASEPGMLYYSLDAKPGTPVPIYIPLWRGLPNRKYNFEFPPGLQPVPVIAGQPSPAPSPAPDYDQPWRLPTLPQLTPQQQAQVAQTSVLAGFLAFVAANWYYGLLAL